MSAKTNETENTPKVVPHKLKDKLFLIPSIITVSGLFCGFVGIIMAFSGRFQLACIYIFTAIIFDGLDGRVARKLNATSDFGREFDSLSDVIAFGVAPAILVYNWAFVSVADEFGLLVAFVYAACGATRLARFNVTTAKSPNHFEGLPIPGAAAAIIALVYLYPEAINSRIYVMCILTYMLFLSAMMVSSIPFWSAKKMTLEGTNPRKTIFSVAVCVAVFWYQFKFSFLALTFGYALSGPATILIKKFLPKK